MSLQHDRYEIMVEGQSHCPQHKEGRNKHGRKDFFPCVCHGAIHDECSGSCFIYCDVDSDHTCGECVHWMGNETCSGERHKLFGLCFYRIGHIGSWYPTCCPDFVKRTDDVVWDDFIEDYVFQHTGKNDSSPECREARKAARELWRKKYE